MINQYVRRLLSPFQSFFASESAGGLLLLVVAVLAFAWANSPWAGLYEAMKSLHVGFSVGDWHLEKELLHWVNDGLMAIFFLLVGLEIKRELLVGELADRRAAALPILAALGGMVIPALLYAAVNHSGPGRPGWGVPMATDIAFALGVMSLLGERVPLGLKVFLTALAIVDDLGAVLVIAVFYSHDLRWTELALSVAIWVVALAYGRLGGRRLGIFALLGVGMWYLMLASGIHATVAGVLLALAVPMRRELEPRELGGEIGTLFRGRGFEQQEVEVEHLEQLVDRAQSPLHELEHSLEPWIAYAIMPVFALFNAGFELKAGVSLTAPIAFGALLGLLFGKPLGVVAFAWLAVRAGFATLPRGGNWPAMWGTGFLAGVGFTMALFIAALAFPELAHLDQAKLGVLAASAIAGVVGLVILGRTLPPGEKSSAG